jgi:hypothetical protein
VGKGFAHRPGYYAKLSWQLPLPLRLELFRYDNRADPEASNEDLEWGWRTRFNQLGAIADLGADTQLRMQAISGDTRMGMIEDERRWVDTGFRSAFVLLSRPIGPIGLAARLEAFDTRNQGSEIEDEYDDTGWSAMVAGKRDWGRFTGVIELLHVSSKMEERDEHELAPRQGQTSFKGQLRLHW